MRVTDANPSGGRHHYRLTLGVVPVVTSAFPLGRPAARRGRRADRRRQPEGGEPPRLGAPIADRPNLAPVVVTGSIASRSTRWKSPLGKYREVRESEGNNTPGHGAAAVGARDGERPHQRVAARRTDADLFRVTMAKGQTLVAQVAAQRLGSSLDSLIEVLDARGAPVPRARLRAVWETTIDLRSRGRSTPGLRLLAWDELGRGDYVYVDRELIRVQELPKGPDEDVSFVSFRGRRLGFEETTPEGHALMRPVYKVELHPPGAAVVAVGPADVRSGVPQRRRRADVGKDSRLTFTAPAAGTYYVRLTDARGTGGPRPCVPAHGGRARARLRPLRHARPIPTCRAADGCR